MSTENTGPLVEVVGMAVVRAPAVGRWRANYRTFGVLTKRLEVERVDGGELTIRYGNERHGFGEVTVPAELVPEVARMVAQASEWTATP